MKKQTAREIANIASTALKSDIIQVLELIVADIEKKPLTELKQANNVSPNPGIYMIYNKTGTDLLYIGETGNLLGRKRDLYSTYNHTFRRHFGNEILIYETGFKPIHDSKRKFPPELEAKLNRKMDELKVRFASINIGRKEIEEYLVEMNKDKKTLFNVRQSRH